jgi:NAD(P)H-dependent FMN reductase
MITVIAGSNRADNNTKKVAREYNRILTGKGIPNQLLALDEMPVFERNAAFVEMEKQFLLEAEKFIFIVPEYNGSYSGILKLLIDNSDVKPAWANKKALLTGVSTGRAGNLRGLEHLTGSLLHMKMIVHPNRLPISVVNKLLDAQDHIADPATWQVMENQIQEFIRF